MDITYNPESLRPKALTTSLHGLRIQLHKGIPNDAILTTDDTGFVLVQQGVIERVSFDAVVDALERDPIGRAALEAAQSVRNAASAIGDVAEFFDESKAT
jgi:hypothetical protein